MEKVTSVKIDNDKWEILKGKGYRLQDILDDAFNNILNIENKNNTELIKSIDKLKNENKFYKEEIENIKKETSKLESKINENNYKIKEFKKAIKADRNKKVKDNNECTEAYKNLIEQLIQTDGKLTPEVTSKINSFADKWNINKKVDLKDMLYDEYVNKTIDKQEYLVYNINDFSEDN